jgi:hypothetical protein
MDGWRDDIEVVSRDQQSLWFYVFSWKASEIGTGIYRMNERRCEGNVFFLSFAEDGVGGAEVMDGWMDVLLCCLGMYELVCAGSINPQSRRGCGRRDLFEDWGSI